MRSPTHLTFVIVQRPRSSDACRPSRYGRGRSDVPRGRWSICAAAHRRGCSGRGVRSGRRRFLTGARDERSNGLCIISSVRTSCNADEQRTFFPLVVLRPPIDLELVRPDNAELFAAGAGGEVARLLLSVAEAAARLMLSAMPGEAP